MFSTHLILLFVAFAGQPGSQEQAQAKPAAQVDALFEKWNKTSSPGCAVSVMKDGRIIYKRGYGMADLDHDVTITPASVFHVASVSAVSHSVNSRPPGSASR